MSEHTSVRLITSLEKIASPYIVLPSIDVDINTLRVDCYLKDVIGVLSYYLPTPHITP